MSLTTSEMTPADIAAVTNNNGGGMFGGDNGAWWIIVLFLFAGWGRGGLGGGFGGGGGDGISAGFAWQGIDSGIRAIQNGISDSTFALNNTINQNFRTVDNAICSLGYNVQSGINGIAHQISDCCCTTQRAIDGVNYNMATQACETRQTINTGIRDVLENQNNNARAILDALTAQRIEAKDEKIAELQSLVNSLNLAQSQANQNNFLINQLRPCPVPAYITCNPYAASYGYGGGNGCGCAS